MRELEFDTLKKQLKKNLERCFLFYIDGLKHDPIIIGMNGVPYLDRGVLNNKEKYNRLLMLRSDEKGDL